MGSRRIGRTLCSRDLTPSAFGLFFSRLALQPTLILRIELGRCRRPREGCRTGLVHHSQVLVDENLVYPRRDGFELELDAVERGRHESGLVNLSFAIEDLNVGP